MHHQEEDCICSAKSIFCLSSCFVPQEAKLRALLHGHLYPVASHWAQAIQGTKRRSKRGRKMMSGIGFLGRHSSRLSLALSLCGKLWLLVDVPLHTPESVLPPLSTLFPSHSVSNHLLLMLALGYCPSVLVFLKPIYTFVHNTFFSRSVGCAVCYFLGP